MKLLLKYKPFANLVVKTKNLVGTGHSPHQLSLAITLGIIFGVFPFLGVTTLLLALIAFTFKLNMVIIQLANYVVYPLQVVLYIPFIKIGKLLGNMPSVSPAQILEAMKVNWVTEIGKLWYIHLWAILAWAIVAAPSSYIIYYILKDWIQRIKNRISRRIKTHIQVPDL
jgi:uncharacterized protein (DUF2062 family)